MKKLVWAASALVDLENIHEYIAQDSLFYANVFCLEIIQGVEKLADFPKMGRHVPEYNDEHVREIIISDYRIIYETIGARVNILTVIHGAKLLRNPKKFII